MVNPHDYRIRLLPEEINLFKEHKVKKVLELFPGDKKNIEELKKLDFDVIGTKDLYNKTKNPLINYDDESFDLVYSYQYINHGYKDQIINLFKEVYRILKPKGIFSLKISDIEQFNLEHVEGDNYKDNDDEFSTTYYKKLANHTFMKLDGEEKGTPHYAFKKGELSDDLEKLGFKIINLRIIRWNIIVNVLKS